MYVARTHESLDRQISRGVDHGGRAGTGNSTIDVDDSGLHETEFHSSTGRCTWLQARHTEAVACC